MPRISFKLSLHTALDVLVRNLKSFSFAALTARVGFGPLQGARRIFCLLTMTIEKIPGEFLRLEEEDPYFKLWYAKGDAIPIWEYGETSEGEKRYSPAQIIRITKKPVMGNPQNDHISTSYIERQNLTVRMHQRRFTRLTNGFSKSLKHHEAAVDLHYFFYYFMKIHNTLRVTPAMEAKVTNHLWTWADLLTGNSQSKAA